MTYKELFKVGQNFDSYVKLGTISEQERIPKNSSRIIISEEIIKKIKGINKKVYILASGEMWCPDCQLNITVAERLAELNENIELSVISLGRGRKYMSDLLGMDKSEFKVPTIVVLDDKFNEIGNFIERPKKAQLLEETPENELFYLKGNFLSDTVEELSVLLID